jgi:acetyltransferase-like isoleucine patch superfamily enzyme
MGNPVRLRIGNDVTLCGVMTIVGSKPVVSPVVEIGHRSYLGYQVAIVSGRGIYIGQHVLIANRVFIAGDDSHPIDPTAGMRDAPPRLDEAKSVWIEDGAWLGEGSTILKGVRVGYGAVVAAQAVVTKDVPPYTVVAGNPAKVVKHLDIPGTPVAQSSKVPHDLGAVG